MDQAPRAQRDGTRFAISSAMTPASRILHSLTLVMRFAASQQKQATEMLLLAASLTRSQAGCLSCRVGPDLGEPGVLLYEEQWASSDRFNRHMRSQDFRRVLFAMNLCTEEPDVQISLNFV